MADKFKEYIDYIEATADSQPLWRVAWRSKLTGAGGHGSAIFMRDRAEQEAERSNTAWPQIDHWAERGEL